MKAFYEQLQAAKTIENVIKAFVNSQCKLKPHFVLSGASGTGKSFLISSIAQHHKLNLINVNAAQITKEGISGNSLSKVLTPLKDTYGKPTIVFVDEFDKWFSSNSGHVQEELVAVQNEFLKLLEADTTEVFGDYGKYTTVRLDNVLFVFAGAFNGTQIKDSDDLRQFGVRNEFIGRVSLVFSTSTLSLKSLKEYLKDNQNLKEYSKLFPHKAKNVIPTINSKLEEKFSTNNLGIRLVDQLIHQHFLQV
jgi:ATP-dependent protease Clp ATPase subunit